ncbi:hypothetical protein BEN47_15490 [Hymenobacter lapidarius]|uniref:Uncharacterized protein n=1 Tax=Hymenobacter lapidarius TaxID=1908237 RepID=A0A1G1T2E5_9BACT|nr:hypothetical protein [Hymenobacter lapidarius]OGX85038.1 hypothetical protein BEN47_15490 [Hymenobacter lapidarius]
MKKSLMLLAGLALATTAANAQVVTPATPKTEVEVRDNGTVKTTTTTGKTNVGAALENTKDAAGNVARKSGRAVKRGAKKTGTVVKRGAKKTKRAVKNGSQEASSAVKEGTQKLEQKTE